MPSALPFSVSAEALPPRHASLDRFLERAARLATVADRLQVPDCPGAAPRVSALAGAIALQHRGIAALPTVTPRDRGARALAEDLRAHRDSGVRSVLVISGDAGADDIRELSVLGLVRLAAGIVPEVGITVAPGARDLDAELDRCLRRVRGGASFVVTQYLFSPAQAQEFWSAWSAHPVSAQVPCILGVGPIPTLAALERIGRLGAVRLPSELAARLQDAPNFAAAARESFLETVATLRTLPGAGGIHLYTPHGDLELLLEGGQLARHGRDGDRPGPEADA